MELLMNPMKMQEMLEQARQMQEQVQQKLGQTVVEGTAGGGAVTIAMNGQKQVLKVRIDPAAVLSLSGSVADVEMLEDLLLVAVTEAQKKAQELAQRAMGNLTGGLNLPFKLPF